MDLRNDTLMSRLIVGALLSQSSHNSHASAGQLYAPSTTHLCPVRRLTYRCSFSPEAQALTVAGYHPLRSHPHVSCQVRRHFTLQAELILPLNHCSCALPCLHVGYVCSVFDLADKSGVNLKSSVNIGNVTEFDETDDPVPNPVIEAAANASLYVAWHCLLPTASMLTWVCRDQAQQTVPVDKDFYRKFWQLQRCLHNPALCGNGTEWIRLTQVQP